MKVKFSKRILSLFLSVLMVATSVPVFAVTSSAAANNAYGLVGTYLTDNVTDGIKVNEGVTWDDSVGAANFDGDRHYLILNGSPLSGVSSSTGFSISVDVFKRETDLPMTRIFDFNDGSSANTFAFNSGSSTVNTNEQYCGIYKVNGTEVRYNASNDLIANAKDYAWHNILISMAPDGTYTCYVDGVARAVTPASNNPSPSDIMNAFASFNQYHVGRSVYDSAYDGFFNGYMKNLYLFSKPVNPVDVAKALGGDDASSALSSLKAVMAHYENVVAKGVAYTNMADAYNAYVQAQRVYDAVYYGSNASADISAATSNLANAIMKMQPWVPYRATSTSAADGSYNKSQLVLGDEMENVLYTYGVSGNSPYKGNSASNFNAGVQFGTIVFLYNGNGETIACPINVYGGGSSSGLRSYNRRLISAYLQSNSNFEIRREWHNDNNDTSTAYELDNGKNKYVNFVDSQTDPTAMMDNNTKTRYASNTLYYTGTPTGFVTQADELKFNFYGNGSSYVIKDLPFAKGTYDANRQCYIYIIDGSRVKTALENNRAKLKGLDVSNYVENNALADFFAKFDAVTNVQGDDINTYFANVGTVTDDTAGNAARSWGSAMETAVNNLNAATPSNADSAEYQALRDAMTKELDVIGHNAMEAYATNGKGYEQKLDTSYADFKAVYEKAQGIMAAVLNGGYADKANANQTAAALIAALKNLKEISITAPTFNIPSGTYIGPETDVTVTTADGLTTKYTCEYNNSGEGTEVSLVSGDVKIHPFNGGTAYDTVIVRAHSVDENGDQSKTVTATYNLLKQPVASVADGAQIGADVPVTLSFGNTTPVGAIEYSFDNTNWTNYTDALKPFADGSSAKTIFARVVSGDYVSAVTRVSVTRNTAFTIACNSGTEFYDSADENSKISITTPETYSGEIKYRVTDENGNTTNYKTYNSETGIPASDLASHIAIVVEAYGVGDGVQTNVFSAKFINKAKYSSNLVYHESFDDAQINNTTFYSSNGDGYLSTSSNASIVKAAGTSTLSGTAISSYRNNVIKFNQNNGATNSDASYLTLAKNPLASTPGAAVVAGINGVTISYWRYIETNGSVDTNGDAWNGGFMPGLSFATKTGASDTSEYEYFKILSSGYVTRCDKTVDGQGGNGYIDIKPNAQDLTTHAAGNNRGYWVNIAVTIDPNSGVMIYTNGQPHEVTIASAGNYASGNNADLAKDLIEFITNENTEFSICDGTPFWGTLGDYYFDDIRVYTDCKTQVDINNMYTDDDADIQTSAATSHDPTAVTVYTLADGRQVGQAYIDVNNIDASTLKKEYYLFGTGMTIQKSDDAVNWQYVGDSEGRCGYQNQGLFGGVYTEKLAAPLAHAAQDSGNAGKGAGQLVWAPHVIYNLDLGKWCYYAAASSWGSTWSAIFMGTSDSPEGPYVNIRTVYTSNGDSWNGDSAHPANAIDACVYYNADYSKLYMIYGSWAHGIYVKDMDKYTGASLNQTDPGKAICWPLNNGIENAETGQENDGGINNSVEGSYMIYENGYYYLYVSYGSNGGSYSERVFRSTSPDSGFVDINGTAADNHNDGSGVHGNQILSPFYLPIYNYVYASTGHNSVSKVYNSKGEAVTLNSVHARPISTNEYNKGYVANADGELATMQIDISGNTTLVNMIAYTTTGWPVMFPLQYNGTDSANVKLTAYDIEGIYTNDNLRLTVNMNHSKCYNCYFLATSDTTGIAYGTLDSGEAFSHDFVLTYGDNGTTYITVTTTSGEQILDGVFAVQESANGKEIMYGMVNNTNGEHSWGYRSGSIPAVDQESQGDIVSVDDVIYTHKVNGDYALYGHEISDNASYGVNGIYGERVTRITTQYPYAIDTSYAGSIYCPSDEERCRENPSLSGGDYNAADAHDGLWTYEYVENGVTKYEYLTDAEAELKYATTRVSLNLYKEYIIEGYVSNYFRYNESTGKYTEDGIQLLITYYDIKDANRTQWGEYEFCYVMPNPGMAHTVQGLRNSSRDEVLGITTVDRRAAVEIFNRFPYSEGTASTIISDAFGDLTYGSDDYTTGTGKFNSLDTFGDYASTGQGSWSPSFDGSTNTNFTYNYTSPSLIAQRYQFSAQNEGLNPGSYGVHEFTSTNERTYFVTSNVVDVDYYIDYSATDDDVITYGSNGKPTGYSFDMLSANLWWNPKKSDPDNMRGSSYYVNKTGLPVTLSSTPVNGGKYTGMIDGSEKDKSINIQETNKFISGTSDPRSGLELHHGSNIADSSYTFMMNSDGTFNQGFTTMDIGSGHNDNWNGTVNFTGKETLKKNTDTSSAENYANFIMEQGVVGKGSGVGSTYYFPYNTYSYFNIGVATCDKGAVRYLAENVLNKEFHIDETTGELVIDGDMSASLYTVASYKEYLDAIAEAYWFVENSHNTTYNGTGDNAVSANGINGQYEYSTAYAADGTPIYNTTTTGSDIFGTGTTTTDPVQAKIIQDVIDAYNNLYRIEDFTGAVDQIKDVITEDFDQQPDGSFVVKNEGNYTQETVDKYEEIVNFANSQIGYYTDRENPVEGQEYWRYTDLSGSEYNQLLDLVKDFEASLMLKVDATGDAENGGVASAGLSPEIVTKNQVLTDNESKVMWTSSIDNQEYTYSSYKDLEAEVAVAEKLVADTADDGRYVTNPEQTATFMDKTYNYATVNESVYSDAQQSVIDETAVLAAKELVAVDSADAYQNYNTAQYYTTLADLDAYADKGAAIKDNFKFGLSTSASAYSDETKGYPYVDIDGKIYKDAVNADKYTTIVLSTLNAEFGSDAKLNLYDVTFNLYVDGVKVDDAYQLVQKTYGDTVEFSAPSAYAETDYAIAKWTIKTPSTKETAVHNDQFSIRREIQQTTDIALYLTTKVADSTFIKVQDYYGTVLDSAYVTLENGNFKYEVNDNNELVFTDASDRVHTVAVNQAANITFKEWTAKKMSDGSITVSQSYVPMETTNNTFFDLPNGTFEAVNGTVNGETKLEDVKAYTVLTFTTEIADFLAWLKSDDGGKTWYVASYDAEFQTYARPARGMKFVAVTKATLADYSINADDVNAKVPFSFGSATEKVVVDGKDKFRIYCDFSVNPNAKVVEYGVLAVSGNLPADFTKGAPGVMTAPGAGYTSDYNSYTVTTSVNGTVKYMRSFVSYIYTLPTGEQIPRVSYGPIVMCDGSGTISNVEQ